MRYRDARHIYIYIYIYKLFIYIYLFSLFVFCCFNIKNNNSVICLSILDSEVSFKLELIYFFC